MTRTPRTARLLAATVAALVLAVALGTGAGAIPPDGAGSDTPGTSASVSPRTLAAGATLRFSLSGFPAGEIVYVKIDDGTECDASAVHGACVYHQQRIGSNGSVSGSFELPAGLEPGAHWLRFLASEELTDKKGAYLGVKGYTHSGGTDFTVVKAASSGGRTTTGPTGPKTGPKTGTGTTTGTGATTPGPTSAASADAGRGSATERADELVVAMPSAAATPTATPTAAAPSAPAASPSATPAPVVTPAQPETAPPVVAAAPASSQGLPWVGISAVAVALLLGGGLGLLRARRR